MLQAMLLLLMLSNYQLTESREQSVRMRGIFRCGEEIPHNATIELWNEANPLLDFFHQLFIQKKRDPDERLFTTHPDINGSFEINVIHEKFTKLNLYMVVYHQCEHFIHCKSNNFAKLQRWRQFIFRIPQRYVNDGDKGLEVFDLGSWNLQFKFMEEELVMSCGGTDFKPCSINFPEYSPYLQLFWKRSNLPHW
ncbi:Transthyretin-like family protein [Acanthocheilonema viteae]